MAIALGHRAWIAWRSTTIAADGAFYLQSATDLYEGNIQWAFAGGHLHPLHMMLMVTVGDLLGNLERGAYVLSVAASAFALLPLFFLVRRFWNERTAWLSGLIYAFHPSLSLEGSEVLNTGLYLSLFVASSAFIIRATRDGPWLYFPLAGAFAGLTYLTRPEGAVLVFCFVLAVAGAFWREWRVRKTGPSSSLPWMKLACGFLIATLVFSAFSLPYVVWLHRTSGKWRVTRRGAGDELFKSNVAMKLVMPASPGPTVPPPPTPPKDPAPAPSPAEVLPPPAAPAAGMDAPRKVGFSEKLYMVQKKFRFALFAPLFPVLILGFLVCRRQGGAWGRLSPLWGMAALSAAPVLICLAWLPGFRLSERYLLPTVVFLVPWVAAGVSQIGEWMARIPGLRSNPAAVRIGIAVPCLVLLGMALVKTGPARRVAEATFLDAGRWLREHGPLPPRYVLSTSEKIPYYGRYRPYWVHDGDPKLRWSVENGALKRATDPTAPNTVSDRVRVVLEDYKRENAAFLILHERSENHRYAAEFPAELERAGFWLRTTIDKGSRPEGSTVRIYQLNP